MKFSFKETDAKAVHQKIVNALGGRELGKIVQFELSADDLTVVISKLGTSTLKFAHLAKDGGMLFNLVSEKIAFTHRAFKDDVKEKICRVIESVGGKILEK